MTATHARQLGGMIVKATCASVLCCALAAPASAAGRTLAESLAFIRDRVVAEGKINYVVSVHDTANGEDWSTTMTAHATKVSADVGRCRLNMHWQTSVNGEIKQNQDQWIDFAKGRKATVVNREQEIRTQVKADGHPTWVATVSPPVWVVTVVESDNSNVLDFTSQNVAERVARAAEHVMDLCGAQREGF
jgi:hypothetical protein